VPGALSPIHKDAHVLVRCRAGRALRIDWQHYTAAAAVYAAKGAEKGGGHE
jgi:hypothetical protein